MRTNDDAAILRAQRTGQRLGAAARLGQPGDLVIVMAFALMDEKEARSFRPNTVLVDARNKVTTAGA